MSTVIAVVMSCLLSASNVPSAIADGHGATGQCSGSYVDKASGQVVGAWSMKVAFEADAKKPSQLRAVKTSGAAVLPHLKGNDAGMGALDLQTLRVIATEVSLKPAAGFDRDDKYPLVF